MITSICGRFFVGSDGVMNVDKLARVIKSDLSSKQYVVAPRCDEAYLKCNIMADLNFLKQCNPHNQIDSTWWILTYDPQWRLQILQCIQQKHQFWQFKIKPWTKSVNNVTKESLHNTDIVICIVSYLFPEPPKLHFNPLALSVAKYKYVAVSDQSGGVISCAKCAYKTTNCISKITSCRLHDIDIHINSNH